MRVALICTDKPGALQIRMTTARPILPISKPPASSKWLGRFWIQTGR